MPISLSYNLIFVVFLIINLVNLTDYLSCLNIKFSVIGISETWLNDSSHSVDISGFKFLHKYRQNRTGGGVGLYNFK